MELTEAEKTFFLRMALHMERCLDFKAAGQAVLDDDVRIANMVLATDGVGFVGWNDKPMNDSSAARRGAALRSGMANVVYQRLRKIA